jgi:hypothetical protein
MAAGSVGAPWAALQVTHVGVCVGVGVGVGVGGRGVLQGLLRVGGGGVRSGVIRHLLCMG